MRYTPELIERGLDAAFPDRKLATAGKPADRRKLPQQGERRGLERLPVQIRAVLYRGDRFQTTTIENLSIGGVGLDGAVGIAAGDRVKIRLLNGRELSGKVAWWLAGHCGVAFDTELKEDDPLFRHAVS